MYHRLFLDLVPVVGLEPTRCRQRRILNPLRLPLPSHRQICRNPLRRELWRELGKLLNEVYLESLEKSRGRQNDGLLDVLAFESASSTNSNTPAREEKDFIYYIGSAGKKQARSAKKCAVVRSFSKTGDVSFSGGQKKSQYFAFYPFRRNDLLADCT